MDLSKLDSRDLPTFVSGYSDAKRGLPCADTAPDWYREGHKWWSICKFETTLRIARQPAWERET